MTEPVNVHLVKVNSDLVKIKDEVIKPEESAELDLITIPKWKLEELIRQNIAYAQDNETMYEVSVWVVKFLGLYDEEKQSIRHEVLNGQENPIGSIVGNLFSLAGKLGRLKFSINKKQAEEEFEKEFGIVKKIIPIIERNGKKL